MDDEERRHFATVLDDEHGVPGAQRTSLAQDAARTSVSGGLLPTDPVFDQVRDLDRDAGFTTRLAARAVLRRPLDGRWLLFRYPFPHLGARWVIPGGGVEPDESFAQAAAREVLEETGARPSIDRASGMLLFHLLPPRDGTLRLQYATIHVGTVSDELPAIGHREPHWLTPEELLASRPRTPVAEPLAELLRSIEQDVPFEPRAVWLPS